MEEFTLAAVYGVGLGFVAAGALSVTGPLSRGDERTWEVVALLGALCLLCIGGGAFVLDGREVIFIAIVAAVAGGGGFWRLSVNEWDEVIQTTLSSMFYCTRAAVPHMRAANHGRIINMSSVIGQMGNIGQANYAAAKAGMIAFTKTAAKELARNNITVNAVCPGFVSTDMVGALSDSIQDNIKSQIPLGRFAEPEEIAALVRFLCAEGGFFTGAQLSPNGGQYM